MKGYKNFKLTGLDKRGRFKRLENEDLSIIFTFLFSTIKPGRKIFSGNKKSYCQSNI